MKIFKKAISLVLVFAMLAGFAGMTGYSPMSIEAEAYEDFAVDKAHKTYTTDHGIKISMAGMLIKHKGTEGEITLNDGATVEGDYIISSANNDLSFVISSLPSEATTYGYNCAISTEGTEDSYGFLWAVQTGATFKRTTAEAEKWDYGTHYNSYLRGTGGYKYADTIYWKIRVFTNSARTEYYDDYWQVPLRAKSNTVVFSATSSGDNYTDRTRATQPSDSMSGANKSENVLGAFKVPSTVYYNSSLLLEDSLCGNVYAAFPEDAKNIKLYVVDADDNIQETFWSIGKATDLSKTTINSKTYYYKESGINDAGVFNNTKEGNDTTGNYEDWTTYVTGGNGSSILSVCWRLEYQVDETYANSGKTETVTYTQYAASVIAAIPRYRAGWQGDLKQRRGTTTAEKKKNNTVLSAYQYMDFYNLFSADGVRFFSTYKDTETGLSRVSTTMGSYTNGVFHSWGTYEQADGSSNKAYWVGNHCNKVTDPQFEAWESVGVKIFYDPQVATTGTFKFYTQFASTSHSNPKYTNDVGGYYLKFHSNVAPQTYEWDGDNWNSTGSSTTSYYNATATYTGSDAKGDVITDAIWRSAGNVPSSSINSVDTSTKTDATYTIDFTNSYFDGGSYSRLVTQIDTETNDDGWYHVRVSWCTAYHIDVIEADRTQSHAVIDDAISYNYVKAEMNADWWEKYREAVFKSYINCGDLVGGNDNMWVGAWRGEETFTLRDPAYEFATTAHLRDAILDTPEFERGGYYSATEGQIRAGSGYSKWNTNAVYAGSYGKLTKANDPDVATGTEVIAAAYNADSNGVPQSSLGIRNGSYYYTSATWNNYKEKRNNAAKIYAYPGSSSGFDIYGTYSTKTTGSGGNTPLWCYAQADIDGAANDINTAKKALQLNPVSYTSLINAMNNAVQDYTGTQFGTSKHNISFPSGATLTYDGDYINYKTAANDYIGRYPAYTFDYTNRTASISTITVSGGTLLNPKNFALTDDLVDVLAARLKNGGYNRIEGAYYITGVNGNTAITEALLGSSPATFLYTTIEHQDDINRTALAITNAASKIKLIAHYQEALDALNISRAPYDIGGTVYTNSNLGSIKTFQSDIYTPAEAWDKGATIGRDTSGNPVSYETTGKTWYTQDSWTGFTTARNNLVVEIKGSGTFNYLDTYTVPNSSTSAKSNDEYASNKQAEINALVDAYNTWLDNDTTNNYLELKKLDAYVWADNGTNTTGVSDIETKIQQLYDELASPVVYYAIEETNDGGIALITDGGEDKKYTYNAYNLAEVEATKDLLEAYAASNTLADNASTYTSLLATYREKIDAAKSNYSEPNSQGWNDIFTHLSNLAGQTVTILNLESAIRNSFVVSDSAEIFDDISDAQTAYNAAKTQDDYNKAIKALYDALNVSLPSQVVENAVTAAETAATGTFAVYNPYNVQGYESHALYNAFGDTTIDGVAHFNTYTADSVDELEEAIDDIEKDNSYSLLKTPVSTHNAVADTLLANAGLKEVSGVPCLLVEENAKLEVLKAAIDGAVQALDKKVEVAHPSGDESKNITLPRYTAKTNEELRVVYTNALTYYNNNVNKTLSAKNQLEIDKLVFQLLDELEDGRKLLGGTGADNDHWSWKYYDAAQNELTDISGENADLIASAKCEPANEDYFTNEKWDAILHNTINLTGRDNGLALNEAYYGFLETELATPYTNENGETIDAGKNWYADGEKKGWAVVDETTERINVTANKLFDATWGEYATHYNDALDKYYGEKLTIDQQATIDALAKSVYQKRLALKLNLVDFTKDENYGEAQKLGAALMAFLQKTSITRYGYEDVLDENGAKTGVVTESENPLSTASESVYIYKYNGAEIDAALDAKITTFYALFASDNPQAEYGSWTKPLEEGGGLALYNEIKDLLTTEGSEELYDRMTIKKTDDETLTAGFNDLTENYIAGKWENGVYTSTLLNSTQVETLNGKQGVTGLLPAAQAIITPLNADNVPEATNATAGFGGTLGFATDAIFNYTKNPATDLQFAAAMRAQVEGFMGMTFDIAFPEFYNGGKTITAPVFDQGEVNRIKGNIESFWNSYEWPAIYQINGLEVGVSQATSTKDNYFVTKYPSGQLTYSITDQNGKAVNNVATSYTNLKSNAISSVDQKIYKLFEELGGKSAYYTEILGLSNNFHTAALSWIYEVGLGTTAEIDGKVVDLILADLDSGVDGAEGSKITVEDALLTSINNATLPLEQWSTVTVDINYEVRKAFNDSYWYTESYGETINGKVYYRYTDWFIEATRDTLETACSNATLKNILNTYGKITSLASLTSQVTQLKTCWTPQKVTTLISKITGAQNIVKTQADNVYTQIRALRLLPATEAYRDVYNTYLSVMGQHVADGNWNGDSYSYYVKADNVDFTFYNVSQASKIEGMYSELNTDVVPPYGIVSRDEYGSFLGKYTQADEYTNNPTNNPWYNMEQFINSLKANGAKITIDQAEKVNTYNKSDNITSIKETLIDDYLSKLEFDDLVYDRLDAVVKAFLGDNLSKGLKDIEGTLQGMGFTVGGNYNGEFFKLENYTNESLLEVAGILRSQNVLATGKIVEQVIGENAYKWVGDTFPLPIEFSNSYKGTFYTTTTDQNMIDGQTDNSVLKAFLNALNTKLVLKGVNIDGLVKEIARGDAVIPEKYDRNHPAWGVYDTALKDAKALLDEADKYDIRYQESVIDAMQTRLAAAINALEEAILADDYAPAMTLKTSVAAVDEFYSKDAYEVALKKAEEDLAKATATGGDAAYTANPTAGTFFVPNSSGYSLIVYTNELDPRIVINLEDIEQKLAGGTNGSADVMQDAAKQEYISIDAVKTSGVTANVIAGTIVPAHNDETESLKVEKAMAATATQAVQVTNSSEIKGSSAFAILAPRFVEGKATQAAVYSIEARDGSERSVDNGTVYGNPVNQFDFGGAGQEPVDIEVFTKGKISIYIYYYSLKAADGTDEGINADGTALATPAIAGTNVPNALLSGEPGFKGADWRNGILLQRHFSDSHRVWEYVSEIKKNDKQQYNVNGTQVPVYNDPTFGYLNTGSFYYVLDEKVSADADVIAAYTAANNAVAGCMDYDAATAAKEMMISKINAKDSTVFADMKASGRFYNYGDYETDEFGNVLYNGEEPKWINWAQAIGGKVSNGDLVFVHVVDRWGNVVNRIVEITNLDKIGPAVNSAAAGAVTIAEDGGSGLADIQLHNGDFSLGEFDYQISQSQNVELKNSEVNNNAQVSCAGNELTIVNLVPGKTYYIGAEDKAGNRSTKAVKADAEGHIVLTIDNKLIQTGEDMGVEGNSSMFTLNGTDTIILNSGEESSVINADIEGNVFANRTIRHYITTKDTVTGLKTVYQDGTVEEFTAENVTVKDSGDGTLIWTIKRTLTEGQHTYKVYAKVDGEYETYYAPATITATNKSVTLTYMVSGMGRTVLNYSGAAEAKNSNYKSTTIPYGAKVTITAENTKEGCDFYYWMNNYTSRIISTADVYEFTAVTNVYAVAQFTSNSTFYEGKKLVVYVNNAKNVVKAFELADGDDYTVPTGPVLSDYTFMGWSMTKDEVLASEKDTIIVEPIYELNATNTVTITEGNYTATGAGTYTAEDNQRAVVTISADAKDGDGKDFLYWIDADTEEVVSYYRTYSFFCVKNTVLTPVYGDGSTVQAEPIVRITEVKFNALSGKVSFFAERSVPEEFAILQTGIVVTKTESIGTNEEVFVVGGTSTAAGTSTSTANNGFYSANATVATGQTVWARAYVIYETADGEIFETYGPVVSYTVD